MKLLFLLLNLLFVPSLFAQKITIGTMIYDPPFEIAAGDQKHFYGFDIDLIQEICNRIKVDCHFKAFSFSQLFTETLAGNIDLAIAGISITPERSQQFLFSLPYLTSSGQFIAKITNPTSSINALYGQKIGTEKGTVFKSLIEASFNKKVTVNEYNTQQELLQALTNNNVSFVMLDTATAQYWVANSDNKFKSIGKSIDIGTGYGIMSSVDQQQLIAAINKALLNMQNDGTYLKFYKRYFGAMQS